MFSTISSGDRGTFLRVGCLTLLLLCGCGERTMTGGTPGSVTIDGQKDAEIQVQIHQIREKEIETWGFGVTDAEGKFRLLQNGAAGKLYLQPGEYRVTVESVGPELRIPSDFLDPERTPLRVTWSGSEQELALAVTTLQAPVPTAQ